jgi:tartrate-resistant acid phosphatase type 5
VPEDAAIPNQRVAGERRCWRIGSLVAALTNNPSFDWPARALRFCLVVCVLAVVLAPPGAEAGESVVIGSIGDFGVAAYGDARTGIELAVANMLKRWDPAIIFTTGDNNYPGGLAATIDANIGQFFHDYIYPYSGSYGEGASSNRFFPCLGNHDWVDNGQPHSDYFNLPGNERYYSYRYGPVEIFIINSNADPDGATGTSVQGRWLQTALAASTARWKLVSLHHPPYSADVNGAGNPGMRWPFAAWGASAVFAGHDHIYARIHTNNIVYFINGLGGDSIGGFAGASAAAVRYNADYGAMRLEATDTNLVFQFITRGNVIVDTYVLGATIWSPFIVAPPLSQLVFGGQTVAFDVLATGTGTLRYQWLVNSVEIPNATNRVFTIPNVQASHEGDYAVVVSSGAASTRSATARLTILRHPLIVQQPAAQTVTSGATASFRVAAIGSGTLSHQWFFNGAEIVGATATNLVVTNAQLQHAGDYTARVTDKVGSITSNPAKLNVLGRPTVTLQPVSQSAVVGETVVFSTAATGLLPMGYSWRRNGRILTNVVMNQSTCFWAIYNVQLTNAGNYQVGVTNLAGIATGGLTTNAVLTVLEDTDGDGMPDLWELANGFDPGDSSDAALDADGDQASNLQEYLAGTDPNSRDNHLRIETIRLMPSGSSKLEFTALSNKTYAVEFRDELSWGGWNVLEGITASSTNRLVEVIDPTTPSGARRFYRLVTPRLP